MPCPQRKKQLICARGSDALKRFDLGVQRIKLNQLGISSAQRRLNIPHFNRLMKRILFEESFTRDRYRELIVVAPDPNTPLTHWTHTRDTCAGSSMLPPVGPAIDMFGIIDGQHLGFGIKCVASGSVCWIDQPGVLMSTPSKSTNTKELEDTIQNGFYCRVLSHDIYEADPEGLKSIVMMSNLDQAHALVDTEVNTFEVVSVKLQSDPSASVEEVIEHVKDTSTCAFNTEDLTCFFNLAKVVPYNDVEDLVKFYNRYCTSMDVILQPKFFDDLCALPIEAPKLKCCAIMANLMSPKNNSETYSHWQSYDRQCY